MRAVMRPGTCAAAAVWLASALSGADWTPLFDGRSLAGWRVECRPEDREKNFWQARAGSIVCDSRGRRDHDYVWLVRDGEYSDFELRLQVRGFSESSGNTGVQVRSRYNRTIFWMHGPQVDIHPPMPWRTGLIYDETRETRRWIFPSLPDFNIDAGYAPKGWTWREAGWNDVRILCRGLRIQSWLNGVPAADFDGSGVLDDEPHRRHNVGLKGNIALQLHNRDELFVEFRDIEIRTPRH